MVVRIGLGALALGFGACAHSDAPVPGEAADGSVEAGARDSGSDADDGGAIEPVDASTSCSDLFTLARRQLDEAVACDVSVSTGQCAGLVDATCGCKIAVNSQTSNASASYLNTLAVIQAKMCGGKCPPQYCPAPGPAQCVMQSGSTGGVCVHRP